MRKSPRGIFLSSVLIDSIGIIGNYMSEVAHNSNHLPPEVSLVLYEAAEAEDRFYDLNELHRVGIIYKQLDHELGKLAAKGIDISAAFPPKKQGNTKEA